MHNVILNLPILQFLETSFVLVIFEKKKKKENN